MRAYVDVVVSDSPLSDIPSYTDWYRKVCSIHIRKEILEKEGKDGTRLEYEFLIDFYDTGYGKERTEFDVNIEGTGGACGVDKIRKVDKDHIDSGIVRIGFSEPDFDIIISCDPEELKKFVYTLEAVLNPEKLPEICDCKFFAPDCICEVDDVCPDFEAHEDYNKFCILCYRSNHLVLPPKDVAIKLKPHVLEKAQRMPKLTEISVNSYVHLHTINVSGNNLVAIPEELGLLPCLSEINLSHNQLGLANNWNWLVSPFMRENLRDLRLDRNEMSSVPEAIVGLKNLEALYLSGNRLRELPDTMRKMKHLSVLSVKDNRLTILPSWMYRKEGFFSISTDGNDFHLADNMCDNASQLKPDDFETVRVPTLMETVASYIITERFPFWHYNIPATLSDYLEEAYECGCGSLVFRNTIGRVVRCRVDRFSLGVCIFDADEDFPIARHCCSYQCYKRTLSVLGRLR